MAACTPGGTPGGGGSNVEDTAVEFMEAYAAGDDATMCELADREVGDCTTSASVEVEDDPEAGETFDNEERSEERRVGKEWRPRMQQFVLRKRHILLQTSINIGRETCRERERETEIRRGVQ